MEPMDRKKCRSIDSHINCVNYTTASSPTTCNAGTTPGANWYLPDEIEAGWVWAARGTGTPESSNGLCVTLNAGSCTNVTSNVPSKYWTRTPGVTLFHKALGSGIFSDESDTGALLSVRCVRRDLNN